MSDKEIIANPEKMSYGELVRQIEATEKAMMTYAKLMRHYQGVLMRRLKGEADENEGKD